MPAYNTGGENRGRLEAWTLGRLARGSGHSEWTVRGSRGDICPSRLVVSSRDELEVGDELSVAETLAMVSEASGSPHAVSRNGTGDLSFARNVRPLSVYVEEERQSRHPRRGRFELSAAGDEGRDVELCLCARRCSTTCPLSAAIHQDLV